MRGRGLPFDSMGRRGARASPHSARGERIGRRDGMRGRRAAPFRSGRTDGGERTGARYARRHIPLGANGSGEGTVCTAGAPPHSAQGERMGEKGRVCGTRAATFRSGRTDWEKGWVCAAGAPPHSARGERMGRRDGARYVRAVPFPLGANGWGRKDGCAIRAPPHSARGERMGRRDGMRDTRAATAERTGSRSSAAHTALQYNITDAPQGPWLGWLT